jgi:uncharacterized protein YhaN
VRITRLRLTDFKRHADLTIEPAAGLTIVRGPNESGKSTLQEALEFVLFRKAESGAQPVLGAQRWGAAGPPRVELSFEADGRSGRLTKSFAPGKGECELVIGDEAFSDPTAIQQTVAELTGIPTDRFFRSTASVGHAELQGIRADEPLLADRLQKAISGSDRGTAVAKRKLDEAVRRYRSEGTKNPGLLKSAREEVAQLEAQVQAGDAAMERLGADRAQWVAARERRLDLDAQLARQEAELAEAERAVKLVERRDEAQGRYERLRRASELLQAETQLQRTAPTAMPLTELRTTVGRAGSLSFELSELEADLAIDVEAAAAAAERRRPPGPWRWIVIGALLALVGWLIGSLVGDIVGLVALVVLGVAAFVALALGVRAALRARQFALAQKMAARAQTEHRETERDRQESFRRRRREFEQSLAALGVRSVDEANALLAAAETHTAEMARIEGELRGLGVEERDPVRLAAERDRAANEAEQARHALAALGDLGADPLTVRKRVQMLVDGTRPARDKARSEEDQSQGRVDSNDVDAEQVAAAAERLLVARQHQAELMRRATIYEATLKAILAAEEATMKTAARYLEERMGPDIAAITEGRYSEIQVDETNLAFRVRSPERGDFVELGALSQGTADQLYLTARLGLVRLITMDRRPPLVLDDPFVTFDAERAERALRLVKDLAAQQGFQVLYLTCTDRHDALADHLVVLDAPA